jgi:hypothetical protein
MNTAETFAISQDSFLPHDLREEYRAKSRSDWTAVSEMRNPHWKL